MCPREEQNKGVPSGGEDDLSPVIPTQMPSGFHYIEINDISEDLETSIKKSRVITLIIIALCMILGSYLVVKNRLYDLSFKFERDGRMTIKRNLNMIDMLPASKSNTAKIMDHPITRVHPNKDEDLVKILEKRILTLEKRLFFFETSRQKEDQNDKFSFFPLLAKNRNKPAILQSSENSSENFLSRLRVARERKNEKLLGKGSLEDQSTYFMTYGAPLGLYSIFDGIYTFFLGGGRIQIRRAGEEKSSVDYKREANALEFRIREKWQEKSKIKKEKELEDNKQAKSKSKNEAEKSSAKFRKKVEREIFELKTRLDKESTELQKDVEKGKIRLKKKEAREKSELKKKIEKEITEVRRETAKKEAELKKKIKEKENNEIMKRKQKEEALLERKIEKETIKLRSQMDGKTRELKKMIEKEEAALMKRNKDWRGASELIGKRVNATALKRQLEEKTSRLKDQKESKEKADAKKKRKDMITSANPITLKTKKSFKIKTTRNLESKGEANGEESKAKWYHFSPMLLKTSQKRNRTMSPKTVIRLKQSNFMEESRKHGFFSAILPRVRSEQKREGSQDSSAKTSLKTLASANSSTIPEHFPMESKRRSKMLFSEIQLRRRKQTFKSVTASTKINGKAILIQNSQRMHQKNGNWFDTIRNKRRANRQTIQESKLDAVTHSATHMGNIFNFREGSNAYIHGAPLKENLFSRVRFRRRTKKLAIRESRQAFNGVAPKGSAHSILSFLNIISGFWNSSFGRIFDGIGNLRIRSSRQFIHDSRTKQKQTLKQLVVKEKSVGNRLFQNNESTESFASLSTNIEGGGKKNLQGYLGIRVRRLKRQD